VVADVFKFDVAQPPGDARFHLLRMVAQQGQAGVDSRSQGDAFIYIDGHNRRLAEFFRQPLLNERNAGAAAYQKHLVDFLSGAADFLKTYINQHFSPAHQRFGGLFKLLLGNLHTGAAAFSVQNFFGGRPARQGLFDIFGLVFILGLFLRIRNQRLTGLFLIGLFKNLEDFSVKIHSAQGVITLTADDGNILSAHIHNRHVKGASAKVIHQNTTVDIVRRGVIQGCGHRFIYNPDDIQSRQRPGIHRRFPPDFVKMRRYGNYHAFDARINHFSILFEFFQN